MTPLESSTLDDRNATPASASPTATVQLVCPRCDATTVLAAPATSVEHPSAGEKRAPTCPQCELPFGRGGTPPEAPQPVDHCCVCGNEEFYIQKDFNRNLGIGIVVLSAIVVYWVMLLTTHWVGIPILFAIALLDFVVYHRLRNVTVCYLCQSLYRGYPLHPDHTGFYLGLEEKHKPLRQDWLAEIEATSTDGTPPSARPTES